MHDIIKVIVVISPELKKRKCRRRFEFCTQGCCLKLNHKMPKSKWLRHKNILWDQKRLDFEE